ncbi:MAG TPA: 2-amino-4-hydroxy-6-hydroxymethyldihydropteridine diphosphokinase [Candidatus Acidoferrales bacterium]|nr:2-amino-4-hydroxy-6-hydroxymethyldihydropteridine diphosphokinase [Candidatus Acidoferrales bacterium]
MKRVYVSLGSNMGDRERNLHAALDRLDPVRVSPIYETEPVDYKDQPWFLNLVAEIKTDLFPKQLLGLAQRIERESGRVRLTPKGPRTIDVDILLFGSAVMRTPELEIPHPRLAERRFVLVPLADLEPGLRHPVTHRTVREMLAELADTVVVRPWKRSTPP